MDSWKETVSRVVFERPDWMAYAQCVGHPDLFFPITGPGDPQARKTCAECSVAKDCLRYALKNKEIWGIWGGLNHINRKSVRNIDDVKKCVECGLLSNIPEKGVRSCKACRKSDSQKLRKRGLA